MAKILLTLIDVDIIILQYRGVSIPYTPLLETAHSNLQIFMALKLSASTPVFKIMNIPLTITNNLYCINQAFVVIEPSCCMMQPFCCGNNVTSAIIVWLQLGIVDKDQGKAFSKPCMQTFLYSSLCVASRGQGYIDHMQLQKFINMNETIVHLIRLILGLADIFILTAYHSSCDRNQQV